MAKNINALSFMKKDKFKVFNKNFKKTKNKKKFNDLLSDNLWSNLTFSALREYLRYEDKNSMRFSLESRLPFLDYELVQKAFSLSNEYKIKNGLSKYVLRCIAKNKIPDPTLNRKDKMGFVSPQEIWQKKVLKNEFDLVFERIRVDGIFDFIDSDKVYETYQDYCADKHSDWNFIWRVYILYKWKVRWEVKNNSKV
jgi:asparagine synthase (glutamine-hydrolysing)